MVCAHVNQVGLVICVRRCALKARLVKGVVRYVFVKMAPIALTPMVGACVLQAGPGSSAINNVLKECMGSTAPVLVAVSMAVHVIIYTEHVLVVPDRLGNFVQSYVLMVCMASIAHRGAHV